MEFVPSSAPFGDFLISNIPGLENLSLPSTLVHKKTLGGVTIFHSIPNLKDGAFFGIGRVGTEMSFGPRSLNRDDPFDREFLSRPDGQFAMFSIAESGEIVVRADYFGLVPLYIFSGNGLAISNRVHLLVELMKHLGHRVQPSIASISSNWFADHAIGFQQTGRETIAQDIELLQADEIVSFQDEARVVRNKIETFSIASEKDYHDIILMGAKEIQSNILASANSGLRVVSNLSGGQDSRALLAAIISLDLHRTIPFLTLDHVQEDSEIASGLVSHIGAGFDSGGAPFSQVAISVEEQIASHKSIYFGSGHDFRPSGSTIVSKEEQLRLMGGCGELYRGFYQKQLNAPDNRDFSADDVHGVLNTQKNWHRFPADFRDAAYDSLYRTFSKIDGRTFSEKLDWHYFHYRNRYHFGLKKTLRSGCVLTYNPLASPTLHRLSHSIPHAQRVAGKVIFDVTRAMNEEMAFRPYHVPFDLKALDLGYEPLPALPPKVELMKEAHKKRRLLLQSSTSTPTARIRQDVQHAVESALEQIQDDPIAGRLIGDRLAQRIRALQDKSSKVKYLWMSRIVSLCNVLE